MKAANPWISYRTRFLVQAKQLTTSLTFTDALGRQHSGCKGDYLVESSDGALRIAPRQIFEDVYVPLLQNETREPAEAQEHTGTLLRQETLSPNETSPFQSSSIYSAKRQRGPACSAPLPTHLTRKSPQPYRDTRNPSPSQRSL
jgi:hypothetical protein